MLKKIYFMEKCDELWMGVEYYKLAFHFPKTAHA